MPEDQAPAPEDQEKATAAATPTGRDPLDTPEAEASELDELIRKGLKAHNTVGFMTFLGVVLLAAAALYFHADRITQSQSFSEELDLMVRNQADADQRAYRRGEDPRVPVWPRTMYRKMREEMFLVAVLTLLMAAIFVHIEKAKQRRNDVLVYRALAREIEKLRLRLKRMEKQAKAGGDSTAASNDEAKGA